MTHPSSHPSAKESLSLLIQSTFRNVFQEQKLASGLREALDHLLEEQKGIARLLEGNQNLQRNGEL